MKAEQPNHTDKTCRSSRAEGVGAKIDALLMLAACYRSILSCTSLAASGVGPWSCVLQPKLASAGRAPRLVRAHGRLVGRYGYPALGWCRADRKKTDSNLSCTAVQDGFDEAILQLARAEALTAAYDRAAWLDPQPVPVGWQPYIGGALETLEAAQALLLAVAGACQVYRTLPGFPGSIRSEPGVGSLLRLRIQVENGIVAELALASALAARVAVVVAVAKVLAAVVRDGLVATLCLFEMDGRISVPDGLLPVRRPTRAGVQKEADEWNHRMGRIFAEAKKAFARGEKVYYPFGPPDFGDEDDHEDQDQEVLLGASAQSQGTAN